MRGTFNSGQPKDDLGVAALCQAVFPENPPRHLPPRPHASLPRASKILTGRRCTKGTLLVIDGIHFGGQLLVVALGIAEGGEKLWQF